LLTAVDMCALVRFVVMMADTSLSLSLYPSLQKSKVSSMKVTNVISTERTIFHRIKNGRAWRRVQRDVKERKRSQQDILESRCHVMFFPLIRAFVQKLEKSGCNAKIS
jgi:uridine kinase